MKIFKRKTFNKIILFLLIACFVIAPISVFANEANIEYIPEEQKVFEDIPVIGCKAAYVVEPTTGKILYEKNAHEKMYPASTTKILTALLAMEKCQMDDKAVVSQRAIDLVPEEYSGANLRVGEEIAISDLLYALLIPSANEAANVLAEHISGSVEEFAELCNNRAKELGCEMLHFVNPNGIHDENHYCSAYDLYLIAKECQKYEIFNEIVKTKKFTLPATNMYPTADRTFTNTNEMLLNGRYNYPSCTGIKTGHTTPAGYCFVGSSTNNGIDLITVVLGGKINAKGLNERFYDTKQLMEFVYNNYSMKEIAKENTIVAKLDVGKATKETSMLDVVIDSSFSTIVPNDLDVSALDSTIELNDNIQAPIEEGQSLGKIVIHADGVIYTADVVASHSVEKLPYMRYNLIIIAIIILSSYFYILVIKKSKKHRIVVIAIVLILVIAEVVGLMYIVKEVKDNSITKTIEVINQNY